MRYCEGTCGRKLWTEVVDNLVPRVLGLLGQRFGCRERLWDNGLIQFFRLVDSKTIGSSEHEKPEVAKLREEE